MRFIKRRNFFRAERYSAHKREFRVKIGICPNGSDRGKMNLDDERKKKGEEEGESLGYGDKI